MLAEAIGASPAGTLLAVCVEGPAVSERVPGAPSATARRAMHASAPAASRARACRCPKARPTPPAPTAVRSKLTTTLRPPQLDILHHPSVLDDALQPRWARLQARPPFIPSRQGTGPCRPRGAP